MSAFDKREFLGVAAGAIAAAAFLAAPATAGNACRPRLAVFDSRIAESRRFAENAARDGARMFDIAKQDHVHWRDVRKELPALAQGGVIGMTRWSDWLTLRALLAERGLRVSAESRIDGTRGTVFAWSMTRPG